ncbi:hypothetical protein R3W88_017343 [Solanum pinnatisectum]|uniref:AIG1-type G domain-containing protein n=1 Tax=Solanum pinnatisectum TaxID=50273 RepID=A0AAV9KZY3_9SOLN|nr:hypothetical protein R3W88_017343 [Solanum pinnatisectum]
MVKVLQATAFLEERRSLPRLFGFSDEPDYIGKEIVKCMDLAKDGIHAVLLVLSVQSRFSSGEQAAVLIFQKFFGEKLKDYIIVVFTGGDVLKDQSLDEYLDNGCPDPLKIKDYLLSSFCPIYLHPIFRSWELAYIILYISSILVLQLFCPKMVRLVSLLWILLCFSGFLLFCTLFLKIHLLPYISCWPVILVIFNALYQKNVL